MKLLPPFTVNVTMMKNRVTISKQWDICLDSCQESAVSLPLSLHYGIKMLLEYIVKLSLTLYAPLEWSQEPSEVNDSHFENCYLRCPWFLG